MPALERTTYVVVSMFLFALTWKEPRRGWKAVTTSWQSTAGDTSVPNRSQVFFRSSISEP